MKAETDFKTENASALATLLSTPARLRVLQLLAQAPRSVDSLAEATQESMPNISQHLKKLTTAGLVRFEKEGTSRKYHLMDERLALLIEDLFDTAERLFPKAPGLTPSSGTHWRSLNDQEIQGKLKKKKAVLLDVREAFESLTTPIEGSVRIPLSELPKMLKELTSTQEYYLICSGQACSKASAGVDLLRKKGFQAFRIKECPAAIRLNPNRN